MNIIENNFMDFIEQNKKSVTVYLVNGVKLEGYIIQSDDSSLVLIREGHLQLVYKNSIATIMPHEAIELPEQEPESEWKPVEPKQGWW